jgi:hypothetical protein
MGKKQPWAVSLHHWVSTENLSRHGVIQGSPCCETKPNQTLGVHNLLALSDKLVAAFKFFPKYVPKKVRLKTEISH